MPSRTFVVAILLFWSLTMGWFAVREVLPRFRDNEAPPYVIDLADEVGANTIPWTIYKKGDRVGSGLSRVRRLPDRTYELSSEFRFDGSLRFLLDLEPRTLNSTYRVTGDGQLLELTSRFKFRVGTLIAEEAVVEGKVEGAILHSKVSGFGLSFVPNPVPVPASGNVLNPMHLVSKIGHLKKGQSWRVPLIDPLSEGIPGLAPASKGLSELTASVEEKDLNWGKREVPCYEITYRGENGRLKARTWVRRDTSLVLQQEAYSELMELTLIRNP